MVHKREILSRLVITELKTTAMQIVSNQEKNAKMEAGPRNPKNRLLITITGKNLSKVGASLDASDRLSHKKYKSMGLMSS
jgi:hypothetical protein